MKRWLLLTMISGFLISCSPFSRNLMDKVDPGVSLQKVQRDPQPYLGKTVLWGGVIIRSQVQMDSSLLFVRQTDLDYEKRPTHLDRSIGRFLARYPGFLDPAIYKEGRQVTVIGEVTGVEVLALDNTQYPYPVVRVKELHLWEREPVYYPYYDYPPPWYWEPYPYGWRRYPYYPYWYW
jgi:outer membrane lipoprotein